MTGSVESAIRKHTSPGQCLNTPDMRKSASFEIGRLDAEGMILLIGKKKTPTRIPWTCLEGIPAFLRGKGWVVIGTVFYVWGRPGTLDGYLKKWITTGTAGWVAAVLKKTEIVEIDRNRPMSIRLKPGW